MMKSQGHGSVNDMLHAFQEAIDSYEETNVDSATDVLPDGVEYETNTITYEQQLEDIAGAFYNLIEESGCSVNDAKRLIEDALQDYVDSVLDDMKVSNGEPTVWPHYL